jgi:hypothetical protein
MNVYEKSSLSTLLSENVYPGRGIVLGRTKDGSKAAVAYFIMGRSENSRNRIFVPSEDGIRTEAFDPSKLEDPSLIIYHPVRKVVNDLVVTNGDQTDTIWEHLRNGLSFEAALQTREYEPDEPHFTPRISGVLHQDGSYCLAILKSADPDGSACTRQFFHYPAISGLGHFLHTYFGDGNPIPTFIGEPKRVDIPNELNEFAEMIWNSLNEDNKISLYVRFQDLKSGASEDKIINKYC